MDGDDDHHHVSDDPASAEIRRPRWTWDWFLPRLTTLELNSEFVYKFQFRILSRCPVLKELKQNIHVQGDHTQVLRRSDLFGRVTTNNTNGNNTNDSDSWAEGFAMHVPRAREHGRQSVDRHPRDNEAAKRGEFI
ncbi:hypothetical protein BGX23_011341 [Mortierella sp. AD031]|nr:hypothetical protein BGX23_011341 [Mortierella sp. AD031]